MSKNLLSILVYNQPGVLFRVAGMFMRRGYNIDNLTVSTTGEAHISRITAVVDADAKLLGQVIRQLEKLEDVLRVSPMGEGIRREVALVKVELAGDGRAFMDAMGGHGATVVDIGERTVTVQVVGDGPQIDDFLRAAEPFGILETVRSGLIALQRGDTTLRDAPKGEANGPQDSSI